MNSVSELWSSDHSSLGLMVRVHDIINHFCLVKHWLVHINQRISEYKFQKGSEMSLDRSWEEGVESSLRQWGYWDPGRASDFATLTPRIGVIASVLTSTQSTKKRSLWEKGTRLSSVGRRAPVTVRTEPKAEPVCPQTEDKVPTLLVLTSRVGTCGLLWVRRGLFQISCSEFNQVIKTQLRAPRYTQT